MTTVPPLSAFVMMISYLLDSSLIASPSLLPAFGCGCLGLKVLVHSISFFTACYKCVNGMMIFVVWSLTFVFVCFKHFIFIVILFFRLCVNLSNLSLIFILFHT